MKCTSYYREDATITYDEYKEMTEQILREYPQYHWESMKVRKLKFLGGSNIETARVVYDLCRKNQSEEEIFLEKKVFEAGRYFKSCIQLSKEEAERILKQDIEWMKESKKPLLDDFYRQITVNCLQAAAMTDYTREIIQVGKKGCILFNKEVYREATTDLDFFGEMKCPISCVGLNEVHYAYKKKASIPVVLSHMLQQQDGVYEQVALCL